MTLNELIPEIRNLINDGSIGAYRWENNKILGFIRDSIVLLNSIRPESRYINGVLTDIDFGNNLSAFVLPKEYHRWIQGFVYFASGKCLEEDSTDTMNAQIAADFMTKAQARFMA